MVPPTHYFDAALRALESYFCPTPILFDSNTLLTWFGAIFLLLSRTLCVCNFAVNLSDTVRYHVNGFAVDYSSAPHLRRSDCNFDAFDAPSEFTWTKLLFHVWDYCRIPTIHLFFVLSFNFINEKKKNDKGKWINKVDAGRERHRDSEETERERRRRWWGRGEIPQQKIEPSTSGVK